jgi:uncharacterized membrane protein
MSLLLAMEVSQFLVLLILGTFLTLSLSYNKYTTEKEFTQIGSFGKNLRKNKRKVKSLLIFS